jgi:hypothetical protein
MTDTMNGRVDYFFALVIAALPMVRDNRVTAEETMAVLQSRPPTAVSVAFSSSRDDSFRTGPNHRGRA